MQEFKNQREKKKAKYKSALALIEILRDQGIITEDHFQRCIKYTKNI